MPPDAKHALITGSSRGIGRGIALKLAEQRVKIAIHYYKNERAANDTLAEVRKRDSDGFIVQADVSRPEEIKQMFRKVQAQFNAWASETGLPYVHLSRICALSVGENRQP